MGADPKGEPVPCGVSVRGAGLGAFGAQGSASVGASLPDSKPSGTPGQPCPPGALPAGEQAQSRAHPVPLLGHGTAFQTPGIPFPSSRGQLFLPRREPRASLHPFSTKMMPLLSNNPAGFSVSLRPGSLQAPGRFQKPPQGGGQPGGSQPWCGFGSQCRGGSIPTPSASGDAESSASSTFLLPSGWSGLSQPPRGRAGPGWARGPCRAGRSPEPLPGLEGSGMLHGVPGDGWSRSRRPQCSFLCPFPFFPFFLFPLIPFLLSFPCFPFFPSPPPSFPSLLFSFSVPLSHFPPVPFLAHMGKWEFTHRPHKLPKSPRFCLFFPSAGS